MDWLGLTKIATDPLGRAEKVQYPDGKTVSYTYGKAGERTSITYPDGKTIYYGFDDQVSLSEMRDGASQMPWVCRSIIAMALTKYGYTGDVSHIQTQRDGK